MKTLENLAQVETVRTWGKVNQMVQDESVYTDTGHSTGKSVSGDVGKKIAKKI